MKYQPLISMNNKKNISKCLLLHCAETYGADVCRLGVINTGHKAECIHFEIRLCPEESEPDETG